MSTVGTRLRTLRQAKGLSQQALAGDGMSAGYISLIESGKRTPSAAATEALAGRLGVPVDELLDEVKPPASDEVRLDINFARLSMANGNAAVAVHALGQIPLETLDSATMASAALVLAEALQETGDLDRAVGVLEALTERCRHDEAWTLLAQSAIKLSAMYIESGDIARSIEVAQQAILEVEAAGLEGTDDHLRLGATYVWALIESGDLLFAARRVQDFVAVAERLGSSRARGSIYWNAALVAHERGRVSDALRLTERALALLGEQEESRDVPRLRLNYAWLLLNHKTPHATEALRQLDRAELELAGSKLDLGTAATYRGRALLLRGDLEGAELQAANALTLLGSSAHVERVSALLLLGDICALQGNLDITEESYTEARDVLTDMKPSRRVARLWRELGDAYRDLGRFDLATSAYDRAFNLLGITPRPMSSHGEARAAAGSRFAAAR